MACPASPLGSLHLTLVTNLEALLAPEPLEGCKHILVAGGRVVGFPNGAQAAALAPLAAELLDGTGLLACPGFVDVSLQAWQQATAHADIASKPGLQPQGCQRSQPARPLPAPQMHQHVAGGGGEAGPSSRTPEATLSQELDAGITTVVGLTGGPQRLPAPQAHARLLRAAPGPPGVTRPPPACTAQAPTASAGRRPIL